MFYDKLPKNRGAHRNLKKASVEAHWRESKKRKVIEFRGGLKEAQALSKM